MDERAPRLTYLVSSLEMGGAQRGMTRLLPGLIDEFDVTVVALRGEDGAVLPELPTGLSIVDLDICRVWHLGRLERLRRLLAETDVLVCSLYHATVVGGVLGWVESVPTVVTWQHNERFQNPLRRELIGLVSRASDRVVADSETVATMLDRTFDFPEGTVATVPIAGIDTRRFTPADGRTDPEDGETVAGILGRLVEQKNHDAVLAAAAALRDEPIRFEVAGDGPRAEELHRLARRERLDNAEFHGFVDDAPAFLRGLDIYVQPSHHEGLCITAVEAMACGLPVVGTAVGGLTETVVDGETGWLVEPGDVDAFTDRIRELHRDPERRRRMGTRARERVLERYSQDVLQERFRALVARHSA